MLADYHTHTPLCRHAEGHPREYVRRALELGLAELGISDHAPMEREFDDWRMRREEMPAYLQMLEEARQAYPDFPLRIGLEVDFLPGQEEWISKLAGMARWDYLIGSVHYISEDWDVDNPRWLGSGRWEQQPVEEVWQRYFQRAAEAVRTGLFDFFAHPDLVKKFGHVPAGPLEGHYRPLIEAAAETDTPLEINTAGLRNSAGALYPSRLFLEMAREAGVAILINSDAHRPQDVGAHFTEALAAAKAAGYRETVRFQGRERRTVPLPEAWRC